MSNRETLINYVKNGGDRFYCSVQIGAGAGFDAKLAGKTWLSSATIEDTMHAYRRYDMLPLYNCGMMDLSSLTTELRWEHIEYKDFGSTRIHKNRLVTPAGSLETHFREDEFMGGMSTKYLITEESELAVLEYYLDAILEVNDYSPVKNHVKAIRGIFGEEEPLDIQWAMQPYELLCFPDTCNTAIFASLCPDIFRHLMDKILRLNEKLLAEVKKGGADFVFLGGPGSEMISPDYYRNFIVPYSKTVTEMVHKNGLLVYSHICSPIEPMLSLGFYNEMGIDLFETLSAPPEGNVKNMDDAFLKLSPNLCTRGNIGLSALLNEKPEQIKERSFEILESAKRHGRKHLLGASDYLFYQTKEENITAMCEAVREFNSFENN